MASSPRLPTAAVEAAPARPPRSGFALTGRSRAVDPRTTAVRGDLADVRLADRVFAPHYAAPLRRVVLADAPLREHRARDSQILSTVPAGDAFDLLDITGDSAWGIAADQGLVGYVDAAILGPAT